MQKIAVLTGLVLLALLFTGSTLRADIDLAQATIYENAIASSVAQLKTLLLPFGAQSGFPDVRPAGLETASYEELYKVAAASSAQGSKVLADMVSKFRFPVRLELSAKYFMKRLEIGSQLFPDKAGNEKVFEFLCRDFATACDNGFEEIRFWGIPELLAFDNIWFKNIQAGFEPVKIKMLAATLPEQITPENAKEAWSRAASALVAAGNEAGIASTKVGSTGFVGFPAWRLQFAIKYFKAAAKADVIDLWHSRNSDPVIWVKGCEKLRKDIEGLNNEMDTFLSLMK